MKRKKMLGVSVEGGCSDVRKRRNPMMIPTTMRRQDSGNMWCSLGVMWKPGISATFSLSVDLQSNNECNVLRVIKYS